MWGLQISYRDMEDDEDNLLPGEEGEFTQIGAHAVVIWRHGKVVRPLVKFGLVQTDIDLRDSTQFQRKVLEAAVAVPPGFVATYGEIAARIGKPKSSRAVGQALARNPIPIVVPCHRVVAADGSLTGYSGAGGIETKASLLRLEGATIA